MKIITVSGAHSNVGKTAFIERLLKKLKGWSCLKVTVLHKGNCPVGRICSGCEELSSKFVIVHDKRILQEKGKDTQRFKAAGAKEVLWLRAKHHGLKKGLTQALSRFKKARGIVIEGNSVLKYLKPDLAIFVKKKDSVLRLRSGPMVSVVEPSVLKPSAKDIINKVDLILTL